MKKILLLLLLLTPFSVLAESSVILQSSQKHVELGEMFQLTLAVTFDSEAQIPSVTIPGIEEFNIFATSQGETLRQVNDIFERTWKLSLTLEPKSTGEFIIGPVNIEMDGQVYSSEKQTIQVGSQTQITNEVVEEKTIEDIKKPPFQVPYFGIFFLIMVVAFYFCMYHFFFAQQKNKDVSPDIETKPISYSELLSKLQTSNSQMPDAEFFAELHKIIRAYIEEKTDFSLSQQATLKELQPYIKNKDLLKVFTDSYMREFDGKKTTAKKRADIIDAYLPLL